MRQKISEVCEEEEEEEEEEGGGRSHGMYISYRVGPVEQNWHAIKFVSVLKAPKVGHFPHVRVILRVRLRGFL